MLKHSSRKQFPVFFYCCILTVQEESGIAQVPVIRRVGNYGLVTVSFETREMTATSGVDYSNANGVLEFKDGQTRALIKVTLRDDSIREFEEQFNITLSNPTGQ